jgi:outer membrane protein assembly factor BamA
MNFRGIIFIIPFLGYGQNLNVSDIIHKGNTFTKDYVINREIQHQAGVSLDSAIAEADKNRLINLGIFADVEWKAIPIDNKSVILEYKIIENDDFFGGRFFGLGAPVYDEKTGWSFTGGGFLKNFRGRNEQVGLGFSTGGFSTIAFAYSNPWISGDHISFGSDIVKNKYDHPFLDYNIEIKSFEINIGRYFGYQRKISLGFELEELFFLNDTSFSKYQYIAPQGSFAYDTRDLYDNPRKGILVREMFFSRFDLNGEIEKNITWIQSFSIYKQLNNLDSDKPLILAWGAVMQMNIGIKDKRFLSAMGSGNTVRGFIYPNRLVYNDNNQEHRFGFNNFYTSVELRKNLIPRKVIADRYEFGATIAVFIDYGAATSDSFTKLLEVQGLGSTGLSLQFEGPWPSIIRLDYGLGFHKNKYVENAIHLEIGHKI